MDHLTMEEIFGFISVKKRNEETMALIARVNGHIRNCDQCLKLVQASRLVHEEFLRMGVGEDFENWLDREYPESMKAGLAALPRAVTEKGK